jgi:quercetin dioxygenase-like cupin family protein
MDIIKMEEAEFFFPAGHYGVADKVIISKKIGAKFDLWYGFFTPGAYAEPHSHDFEQAFFILRGEINFIVNGEKKAVGPNTAVYIPPGEVHSLKNERMDMAELLVVSMTGK